MPPSKRGVKGLTGKKGEKSSSQSAVPLRLAVIPARRADTEADGLLRLQGTEQFGAALLSVEEALHDTATNPYVAAAASKGGSGGASAAAAGAAATAAGPVVTVSVEALERQLAAARTLRALLASNRERLLAEAESRGLVPLLFGWLRPGQPALVQLEALWCLTNAAAAAAAAQPSRLPVLLPAVPCLVALLDGTDRPLGCGEETAEQILWLLGALAANSALDRNAVLQANPLPPLARCLTRHDGCRSLVKIGAWALSSLCDGQPRPTLEDAALMPTLYLLSLLLQHPDGEVLAHACWTCSHLCDGPARHVRAVVDAGLCARLVDLLLHRSWRVAKPALRAVGNIVCAEDKVDHTGCVIDANAVPRLQQLISHGNREIQKEACWTLSNIAAGTEAQIQSVLDSGAMPRVLQLAIACPAAPPKTAGSTVVVATSASALPVTRDVAGGSSDADAGAGANSGGGADAAGGDGTTGAVTDAEVRAEAAWTVLNAATCGTNAQIAQLVGTGLVGVLLALLDVESMSMMALEAVERVLQVGGVGGNGDGAGGSSGGSGGGGSGGEPSSSSLAGAMSPVPLVAAVPKSAAVPFAGDGIPASRLVELEGHKNTAIAKRAQRIRKQYYVSCGVCRRTCTKSLAQSKFCSECRSDICRECDCSRFHLDVQQELWAVTSQEEALLAARKKSKKHQKKKAKQKRKGDPGKNEDDDADTADESPSPGSPTCDDADGPLESGANGGGGSSAASAAVAATATAPAAAAREAPVAGAAPAATVGGAARAPRARKPERARSIMLQPLDAAPAPAHASQAMMAGTAPTVSKAAVVPTVKRAPTSRTAARVAALATPGRRNGGSDVSGWLSDEAEEEEDLVSLLDKTGSIMAVWERLKDQ